MERQKYLLTDRHKLFVFLTAHFGTSFVMKTSYNGYGMYASYLRVNDNVFLNIYLKISYILFKTNLCFLIK